MGRYGTSDLAVFRQMFVWREHAWAHGLAPLRERALIIDCGANVGFASVYLLRLFPQAFVIAVEPDSSNYAILEQNLSRCRERCQTVRAGVWNRNVHLVCVEAGDSTMGHWARQVRACSADAPGAIPAVTVGDLLEKSGCDRIAVLKVDIEGAEAVVFDTGAESWLDRTDAIAIELHDGTTFGPATEIFKRAIRGRGFMLGTSGELATAVRPQASRRPPRAGQDLS